METFLYEKIRDIIWQIAEDDGVYCTLIKGSKLSVLIDTGYGKRDLRAFVEKILLGDISIDVVSFAGHTKGSIGFIIPDEKFSLQ